MSIRVVATVTGGTSTVEVCATANSTEQALSLLTQQIPLRWRIRSYHAEVTPGVTPPSRRLEADGDHRHRRRFRN